VPAGSFVTHYGNEVHYDGAKDEDTILQIVGIGPATSTRAPEKNRRQCRAAIGRGPTCKKNGLGKTLNPPEVHTVD
jgi:hypothetical protein